MTRCRGGAGRGFGPEWGGLTDRRDAIRAAERVGSRRGIAEPHVPLVVDRANGRKAFGSMQSHQSTQSGQHGG